jgi:DegV family protein with EDD domain
MNVAVVTDSTSDMPDALAAQLGVEVVPLYVNFKGQVLKDHLEINTSTIFQGVKEGAAMPSTSQPTPVDFENAFKRALEKAEHVLCLTISSGLSGTFQSANLAAKTLPGKVTVIDSATTCGSLAMMVERAVRLLNTGSSLEDVIAALERTKKVMNLRFSVGSLDFLKKNGRIGGAQALIGGLLNIKPILHLVAGKVEAAGRVRGSRAALDDMINNLRTLKAQYPKLRVTYIYADKPEDVEPLREAGRNLGIEEFAVLQTGPVIASHVGPGTYGALAEPVDI